MIVDQLLERLWPAEVHLWQVGLMASVLAGFVYLIGGSIYNLYFHPLSVYPGPKLWAISRIPLSLMFLSGYGHKRLADLHRRYGETVRIAPNRVSFQQPEAWNDIMGHRKAGESENGKTREFYPAKTSVIGADREEHARQRRILSHGFSARALLEQQPIIGGYVDLLMRQIQSRGLEGKKALNIVAWLNFTTFDIIGDLAFGEPFGSLEKGEYHPWISIIFQNVKAGAVAQVFRAYRLLDAAIDMFLPRRLVEKRKQHRALIEKLADKRMATGSDRLDFMNAMLLKSEARGLDKMEIYENSNTLLVAGSETTATALSGILFYLCRNPAVHKKLKAEIRAAFATEGDINLVNSQSLQYLHACIEEGLRIYPPVPPGVPRITPPEGSIVLGKHLPGGITLDIPQWPMYHSPRNFTRPDDFCPERWLGDPEFKNDRSEAFQPFSYGPRNCLGKNLAYAEMRLILSRFLYRFDITIAKDSEHWVDDQEVFILWDKPELNLYFTPRAV